MKYFPSCSSKTTPTTSVSSYRTVTSVPRAPQTTSPMLTDTIAVIANTIDYSLNSQLLNSLSKSQYIILSSSEKWDYYLKRNNIILLGGHRAPGGVGDIVSELLTSEDKQRLLSSPTSNLILEKKNRWNPDKKIIIIAGYEKEQTGLALREYFTQK
ncbi:MAG: hypothetical protein V1921_01540 [Candidatus Altiarchaeota archaeon]